MVVKIVNDHLAEMLGPESEDIVLRAVPPAAAMRCFFFELV